MVGKRGYMTREEAIKEINRVFEPAYANYIVVALTEGATVSDVEKLPYFNSQEPCDDAVSRQEAIHCVTETELYNETFAEAKMRIAELKPVLPKREQGEWISVNPMVDTLMCSECGENIISEEFKSNYCPNCGAEMR